MSEKSYNTSLIELQSYNNLIEHQPQKPPCTIVVQGGLWLVFIQMDYFFFIWAGMLIFGVAGLGLSSRPTVSMSKISVSLGSMPRLPSGP